MKNKKEMTEEDIKHRYITPAINRAGWKSEQIWMEHSFTDGRIIVRGNLTGRGKRKRADYVLVHKKHLPLAILEAKDNRQGIGAGMQQAIQYGEMLDIPFVYSSNGDGFVEHDRTTGKERTIMLDQFPTEDELWQRYATWKGLTQKEAQVIEEPYYFRLGEKSPRYYQRVAINRTVNSVAQGDRRIMLVMATGTGKTYTAFQIIYRLWKAGLKKRILFLADRNILVDQTMSNDFSPFEKVMTKVEDRKLDSSYEVYLALYHQLAGEEGHEPFRQFSPDFFDLVVIDEAHRGSAKEESRWRRILEYFDSEETTHIGLTATPKETKDTSNTHYFGEPLYIYSLKQGIDDGFLAPYKVMRIGLDRDLEGYRPEKGKLDMFGNEIEDREYNVKDFDRNMILDRRTEVVAERVTEFLKKTDRFAKTIIFCANIDHAERMRSALVTLNNDFYGENSKYIMRITGDNPEGKAQLDNFIDPASKYPTIVTTSKLLTTGVDAKTCKLIVLDSNIESMTEFKQIIGRGTRLSPDHGKEYFTIMDFRNVSRHFADPDFDGDPVQVMTVDPDQPIPSQDEPDPNSDDLGIDDTEYEKPGQGGTDFGTSDESENKGNRVYRVNDVNVQVVNERVQYYDKDGKLITESLIDYTKNSITKEYRDMNEFLSRWKDSERKSALLDELREEGVLLDALREQYEHLRELDDFDLILHLAFDQPPLTKAERANNVKKRGYLFEYQDVSREVLEILLDKYSKDGIEEIDTTEILELQEFRKFGSPLKIVKAFGGKTKYNSAVKKLTDEIYIS